ncbi:hypothetical protein JW964_01085 [candidate division KSB1 bacterium]|nr:hypothetical protein [candidate division KSB1 bacterium]
MKGGIIVRLIDVVFILLLGFISASDIIHKTQIKLPAQLITSAGRQQVREPRPLVIRIFVEPMQDLTPEKLKQIQENLKPVGKKAYYAKDKITQRTVSEEFIKYIVRTGTTDDAFNEELFGAEALEKYVQNVHKNQLEPGQKLIIVIIPNPESMIQGVVNIFDVCRRMKLEYHFRIPDSATRLKEIKDSIYE